MRTYQWVILALVVVGLVLWTAREHFEATQSIKAPPYDDAEKLRIFNMLRNTEQADLLRQAEQTNPDLKKARDDAQRAPVNQTALDAANRALKIKAAEFVTPTIQSFFTEKYKPATVPITNEDVKAFVTGLPVTTINKPILESILKTYFVGQSGVGTSTASGYAATLRSLGQEAGYLIPNASPGSSGSTAPGSTSTRATGRSRDAAPGSGAGAGMGSTDTSTPGSDMTSSGSAMPGNTTGGSSTSVFGPTAGGRGSGGRAAGGAGKFMVWGPIGGGRGEGDGVQGIDSSKTNKYPELLGGLGSGGDKTRIDGVGLSEPSSSWQLSMSGMLPDMKSLGATENSKFLPFSRTPGDMEKIPDPYRVSQTFRTSSYTSKTEPVPFLADFSAFQK